MRVFVAGATGAIGRRLVPNLLAAGHQVTGLTRSRSRAGQLKSAGAEPVLCDVYDAAALNDAVAKARPEVVIHALTDLPAAFKARSATTATDRLRREGTRNLIGAARSAGARRLIAESIAFLYAPGPGLAQEDAPAFIDAPGSFADTVAAALDLERQVLAVPGIDGLVLRYGFLYGTGTWYAPEGSIAADVRRRRYPIVGAGEGVFSFVHVDDAASAAVAAAEHGRPGLYNIVDDDPAPMRDWLPAYATALDASAPRHVPARLARLLAGASTAALAVELRGASNAKAKNELQWSPRYPSWRTGFLESSRA